MANDEAPSDAVVLFTQYWLRRAGLGHLRPLTIGEAYYYQGIAWRLIIKRDGRL